MNEDSGIDELTRRLHEARVESQRRARSLLVSAYLTGAQVMPPTLARTVTCGHLQDFTVVARAGSHESELVTYSQVELHEVAPIPGEPEVFIGTCPVCGQRYAMVERGPGGA